MLVIGLTGLIGSGKSTVANLFAKHDGELIDTDVIAHELTMAGGEAIKSLQEVFGYEILTAEGALKRSKMRELVFQDDLMREQLEQILHPLIFKQVQLRLAQIKVRNYVMLIVPLLFKAPEYLSLITRSLFVDCSHANLVQRVIMRNGLNLEQINAILAKQMSQAKQRALANDVIVNNTDLAHLAHEVMQLHKKYLGLMKNE